VALALASAAFGALTARAPAPAPDAELTVIVSEGSQRLESTVPLSVNGWTTAPPILIGGFRPVMTSSLVMVPLRSNRLPYQWAIQVPTDPPGLDDIAVLAPDGSMRPLVAGRGDDGLGAWSPDDSHILFATARWSGGLTGDLAIVDVATGVVDRLGGGPGAVHPESFSDDGRQVTFVRSTNARRNSQVCLLRLADRRVGCHDISPTFTSPENLTWVPPASMRFSVRDRALRVSRVISLDFNTGETREMASCRGGIPRPQSLAVFVVCLRDDDPDHAQIAPIAQPDLWRSLNVRLQPGQSIAAFATHSLRPVVPYQSITIAGSNHLIEGVPHRLRAIGTRSNGDSASMDYVVWKVLDGPGRIDSSGSLIAHGKGVIRVSVESANGLVARRSFEAIHVEPHTLLEERWDGTWKSRWRAFGDPPATVVRSGDSFAFFNNGDASYYSGAYSVEKFPIANGLAIEGDIESPIRSFGDQMIRVELEEFADSSALAGC
jgi:hypothetical protein